MPLENEKIEVAEEKETEIPISWHRSFGIRFIIRIFVSMSR